MTLGAKILVAAAVLCLLLWLGLNGLGVQPLIVDKKIDVIYGEGEDFYSDAVVYKKPRNTTFLMVRLPHARPERRWISVDFESAAITLGPPPHKLGSLRYRMKNDAPGTKLGGPGPTKDWYWNFTDQGAAFSGDGFSCRAIRIQR